MKSKIPRIKKKINSFLVGEEGKISKQSLLKVGVLLGGTALGTVLSAKKVYAQHCSTGHSSFVQDEPDCCDADAAYGHDGAAKVTPCHGNDLSSSSSGAALNGDHAHCIGSHTSHSNHSSCCGCQTGSSW